MFKPVVQGESEKTKPKIELVQESTMKLKNTHVLKPVEKPVEEDKVNYAKFDAHNLKN